MARMLSFREQYYAAQRAMNDEDFEPIKRYINRQRHLAGLPAIQQPAAAPARRSHARR